MKNIVALALMTITLSSYAQSFEKRERPNFTSEQIAELQTKRMTLQLDLTETQQKTIFQLNKENAVKRQEKRNEYKTLRERNQKPSSKELFKRKSSQLDTQIAHQDEMKNILNEKQFETWKKTRAHQKVQLKKHRKLKRLKAHRLQNQKMRK